MTTLPSSEAREERLADADIMAAVELLLLKKGVCSSLLHTQCRAGIVELVGFTDSLLSRERAVAIAKAVRGVRGVIADIGIRTPDVPDAELKQRAEQALQLDPAAGDYPVQCYAHNGHVRLEGTVKTWAESQLVLRVLTGVPGVRQVDNHLTVQDGGVKISDEDITKQVRELLDWDIRVKSPLVDIRTEQGVVHLSGTVGTAAEHEQAVATAHMAGAHRVDARDLVVAYWALDKELRRQKFAPKADEAVAEAVRDTLRLDPRVQAFEPQVHVRDGVVTLLGTVGNLRARHAAEQDAANVVGVWGVNDLLQVRGQFPSPDGRIQQQIKDALASDSFLSQYSFTVNVYNGKAQLYGTVASHFELERAQEIVASSSGVVELVNCLELAAANEEPAELALAATETDETPVPTASGPVPDHVLAQRLRHRYYWSALLHDQDIKIAVREGRVTLTGTVETWLERRRAAAEALECGARDVNNHLHLMASPTGPVPTA
ncbi:hypothetical protein AUC43_17565 [Hymenobacter sedentarius]|uniref:BON domain-containing protein n=1 Tax=Hymenobacter sedentarius TaxID=1411621 RepID=A0A0U4BTH1_9BACT|nr:BON domain-containing protein [Hymenobacter sedentarius]ALW86727.1 hypothetical protein AUC43_17565 [Hymenobacter sedentarius]